MTGVAITMLGTFEVRAGAATLDIGPHKQRVLLATLASRVNTVLSVDQLIEAVWEDEPPRTARKNLQAYVSMLRKVLGERLSHTAYGYVLHASAEELDVLRFETLSAAGRRALRDGDQRAALASLGAALALWRGPFLSDMTPTRFLAAEAARLAERRLSAYEEWAELCVRIGDAHEVLDTIDELTEAHPHHERLNAAKLTALYRCGRRTDALAYYEHVRHLLAHELGLDPSPPLQAALHQVLGGADVAPATSPDPPVPHQRLPRDVGDFTGREREIGVLVNGLVTDEPATNVALVTGPVGTGKTALALRFAHAATGHFADGQVFVPMRDASGRRLPLADILAALVPGSSGPAAVAAWQARLDRHRLLVILDDAVDEATLRPLLPASRRSAVVVTSRYRLAGIESALRIPLDDLAHDEALELVAKVVGVSRVLSDRDTVLHALGNAGRSPLAVRIVAGRLRRGAGTPPAVDGLTLGDLSVVRRYDDHCADLAPAHRAALRALAAAGPPPYTGETVARTLRMPDRDAARLIETLLDAHILTLPDEEVSAHSERYEMTPLWYGYARMRR